MKVVWKFPLIGAPTSDGQRWLAEVAMPVGAHVLHAASQNSSMQMWALVDPDNDLETRQFEVVGTGFPAPVEPSSRHVSTWQDEPFVWHLFELVEGGD